MVPTASVVSCRLLSFPVGSQRAIFRPKLISHAVPAKTFGAIAGTPRLAVHREMTDSNHFLAPDECALLIVCCVGCGLLVADYRDALGRRNNAVMDDPSPNQIGPQFCQSFIER